MNNKYVFLGIVILIGLLLVVLISKPGKIDDDAKSSSQTVSSTHGEVLEPIVPIDSEGHAKLGDNQNKPEESDADDVVAENTHTIGSMTADSGNSEQVENKFEETDINPVEIDDPNPKIENLGQRLSEMSNRRQGKEFNPVAVRRAITQQDMWRVREDVPDNTPMSDAELSDGRPFVDVDPLRVESLMSGDILTIYIPQESRPYDLVIEEVVVHEPTQSVTWNGHVKDFAEDNHFTATRGDTLIVGAITTPTTHYLFEVYDNVGWIEEAGKLFVEEGEPVIPGTD